MPTSLLWKTAVWYAGQGAPVAPSEAPTMTFDSATIGQGVTATHVLGSNPGAGTPEIRWYKDSVLVEALTDETTHLFVVADTDANWTPGAYYAATDTELLGEPTAVQFLGATAFAITSRYTLTPEFSWTRAALDPEDGSVTYTVETVKGATPVTLTSAEDLNAESYTTAPALTVAETDYTTRLVTNSGAHEATSDWLAYVPAPYIQMDEASQELAAGEVIGTNSLAGTARTGADTNSKIQETGGKILVSASASDTDPVLKYPSIAREAGLILYFKAKPLTPVAGKGWYAGLHSSATPTSATNANSAQWNSNQVDGNLTVKADLTTSFVLARSVGVEYELFIVVMSTGYGYFHVDPDTGKVIADMYYPGGTTDPLYPAMWTQTGVSWSFDDWVIPDDLLFNWVPTAADGFSDTGAPFVMDGLGGINAGGSGFTWTDRLGTFGQSGGKAAAATLDGGGYAMQSADPGLTNCLFSCVVNLADTSKLARIGFWKDANNYLYYEYRWNGSAWRTSLVEVVAGTPNTLKAEGTVSGVNATVRLMLHKIGNVVSPFCGGREDPSGDVRQYTADATFSDTSTIMLMTDGVAVTEVNFDNVVVFPHGENDEYAALLKAKKPLTPSVITIPDPDPGTPLNMPVNPDGIDLKTLIESASALDTIELPQGVYTVPDSASYAFSVPASVTVVPAVGAQRIAVISENGTTPGYYIGASARVKGLMLCGEYNTDYERIVGMESGAISEDCMFMNMPGGGIIVGYPKQDVQILNPIMVRVADRHLLHMIYIANIDGIPLDKNVLIKGGVFVYTLGATCCAVRLNHDADGTDVDGNFSARVGFHFATSGSKDNHLHHNTWWSGVSDSYGNGDGLVMEDNLIGLGARVGGTYSKGTGDTDPVIENNSYLVAQTLTQDTNPTILTLAQLEASSGYSYAQWEAILDAIQDEVTDTVDPYDLIESTSWSYYAGLLRTAFTVPYVAP